MMCAIFVLFMLVFTSLGDSLAASGQRYLDQADQADAASPGMQQQNPPFKFLPCLLHNSGLGLSLLHDMTQEKKPSPLFYVSDHQIKSLFHFICKEEPYHVTRQNFGHIFWETKPIFSNL